MKKNLILVLVLFFVSCGYTTSGSMYAGKKIVIKPVENSIDITSESRQYANYETYPILIENKLTNRIIKDFKREGSLKVVSVGVDALKLTGVITDYRKETLTYTDSEDVEEQRLRLYVDVKLYSASGEVLQNKRVTGEVSYFLSGAKATTETAAQTNLVNDTARRISESVIEQW